MPLRAPTTGPLIGPLQVAVARFGKAPMIPFVQPLVRSIVLNFPPTAISSKLEALAEEAERNYRRVQQVEPGNQDLLVKTVRQFAADVLKTWAAELLKSRSGGPEAFKRAIAPTGNGSAAGFCYAEKLYVDIEGHAMPPDLVKEIQSELSGRRREAQNLWYTPDLVPEGWKKFLRTRHASKGPAQARAPGDVAAAAERRKAFFDPLLKDKGLSLWGWATEAKVDYHTASDYYNGLTNPHRSTLVRLGKALGLLASQLPL